MSNQPNEAAIYALSLLHLGTIDWLPVPGTHRLNGHAARVVLAAIRDGKVPGVEMSHPDQVCSARILNEQISSLRSALANAEKERDEFRDNWNACINATELAQSRQRQAEAKLGEAEKELLVIGERAMCDFDDATVGDVDRVVTDHMKYKDWLRSVMTAASERDRLAAQLAETRGLLGDLLAWLTSPKMQTWQYHENGFFAEDAQKFVNRLSLAPPPDRGAEGES